jgi:hypothetical protein
MVTPFIYIYFLNRNLHVWAEYLKDYSMNSNIRLTIEMTLTASLFQCSLSFFSAISTTIWSVSQGGIYGAIYFNISRS